jgi:hypothetical protein
MTQAHAGQVDYEYDAHAEFAAAHGWAATILFQALF